MAALSVMISPEGKASTGTCSVMVEGGRSGGHVIPVSTTR
jgi:hypothetical protein